MSIDSGIQQIDLIPPFPLQDRLYCFPYGRHRRGLAQAIFVRETLADKRTECLLDITGIDHRQFGPHNRHQPPVVDMPEEVVPKNIVVHAHAPPLDTESQLATPAVRVMGLRYRRGENCAIAALHFSLATNPRCAFMQWPDRVIHYSIRPQTQRKQLSQHRSQPSAGTRIMHSAAHRHGPPPNSSCCSMIAGPTASASTHRRLDQKRCACPLRD